MMNFNLEKYLSPSIGIDENRCRIARILQSIVWTLLVVFLIIIIVSPVHADWAAVWTLLAAIPSLIAVLWLSRRGQISTAVFILSVTLIIMTTVLSTLGQGIHDITNIAYPGILVVSSLVINKRTFVFLTGLTIAAVIWLNLGALYGLFVPQPYEVGTVPDIIIVSLILMTTAFSVNSLTQNLQLSLLQTRQEMRERQEAEQALRESQTMLQLIFDHAFDGISVYEEFPEQDTRRLLDCNTRYAEMAGRSREELLAMGDTLPIQKDIDYPANRQEFLAKLNTSVQLGRFSWLRPDGRDNVIEYAAVARHIDNRFLVIGVDRDITAQVQAAQEREALIKELEAKNTELERFTYTVSHDLKAPLITIGGFLGFLEKDVQAGHQERVQADLIRIGDAAAKMQRLLNELLELSRIGRLMNPPVEVSFETIVREALELVGGGIEARGIQVDIAPHLPLICGDRARLVEVMQNLLDNACKFMGDQPQPRIEIGVNEAALFVRDNGVGIDPAYQERIFGLFDKLDPQTPGTGIGLALVKRIIEIHGGKIWGESAGRGQGATFYFTLPCQTG